MPWSVGEQLFGNLWEVIFGLLVALELRVLTPSIRHWCTQRTKVGNTNVDAQRLLLMNNCLNERLLENRP